MNSTNSFAKTLSAVMLHWVDGEYERALKRVEEARAMSPNNAQLNVLWARLVQLQAKTTHTLHDAKRALQQAVELDKDSPVAPIELGHFLDNVEDDPQGASKAFAQGIAAARHLLIEGLLGQAKTLIQLDKREDAVRCLVEAHQLANAERTSKKGPFASRIEELLIELGQMQSA